MSEYRRATLRDKFPGLGASERGLSVRSDNGFFDSRARQQLFDQLSKVLEFLPVGAEILGDEITLYRAGGAIGFLFAASRDLEGQTS